MGPTNTNYVKNLVGEVSIKEGGWRKGWNVKKKSFNGKPNCILSAVAVGIFLDKSGKLTI